MAVRGAGQESIESIDMSGACLAAHAILVKDGTRAYVKIFKSLYCMYVCTRLLSRTRKKT